MTRILIVLTALTSVAGCRGGVTEEAPVVPIRNMYNQPRYDSQSRSDFFQDGRTMRPPVEGAVAREMPADLRVETGRSPDNTSWELETPTSVVRDFLPTAQEEDYRRARELPPQPRRGWAQFSEEEKKIARFAMIERGHDRFNIYCAPCHSVAGDGNGPVSQRAEWLAETLRNPGAAALNAPTLHDARIRSMPDGQLYGVITHGLRNMPAYAHSIPNADRWAIVQYVRALQVNQASRTTARNDAPSEEEEARR